MNFAEFAEILWTYYRDGRKKHEFVLNLIDNIMVDSEQDDWNPLFDADSSLLRRFFSGDRKITDNKASTILGRLDKYKFSEFILKRPDDTLNSLCQDLEQHGIAADFRNVGDVCSDLFETILKQLATPAKKRMSRKGLEEVASEIGISEQDVMSALPKSPIATVFIKDGKMHIGETSINLPDKLIPPDKVSDSEMGYIPKLYEAYSDAEKLQEINQDNINKHPKYNHNLKTQRECYYNAVYVMERVRGIFSLDDSNQFDIFKDEVNFAINTVHYDDHDNGFIRLKAVLNKANIADVSKSLLSNIPNLIGGSEKMGVCHILMSDGSLKSWVDVYG